MLRKPQDRLKRRLLAAVPAAMIAGVAATTATMAAPATLNAIRVANGGALALDLESDAATVTVANPEVADVAPVGGRRLIILGRAVGQTGFLVFDRAGGALLTSTIIVTPERERTVEVHRGVQLDTMVCAPHCASTNPPAKKPAGGLEGALGALGGAIAKPQGE